MDARKLKVNVRVSPVYCVSTWVWVSCVYGNDELLIHHGFHDESGTQLQGVALLLL